jgi:hypothetical protein
MTNPLTVSEAAIEKFLHASGLSFERVQEAETRLPDYLVTADGLSLMFEVKELAKDENFRHLGVSSRIVGDHIRSKIKQARDQVRCGANQGIPSILLIYNALDPMHMFGTENHDFIDAVRRQSF